MIYSSGSNIGDIVVRSGMRLDSEEVALLMCGTYVEQQGAQEFAEGGILRMPVSFGLGVGRDPTSPSRPPRRTSGWLTPDARAQGGPQFAEPCPEELGPAGHALGVPGPGGGYPDESKLEGGARPMESTRLWRVVLNTQDARLPVLARAEPYVPGRPAPKSGTVVCWLRDGDTVEQVGHSKKVKGYRIMHVQVLAADDRPGPEGSGPRGWVTRELFDRSRLAAGEDWVWFEELDDTRSATRGERRRLRRQELEAGRKRPPGEGAWGAIPRAAA